MTQDRFGTQGGREAETADASDLQRLIDEVSLGLVRIDRRMAVRAANGAAHRLLERRPGALIGRSSIEAFLDNRIESLIRDAVGGASGTAELAVGRDRMLVIRTRPSSEGGAWVALEDVTELRRLQRIRAEFIDNLSHELRTPLTTIRLLTEALSADMARIQVPDKVRDRVYQRLYERLSSDSSESAKAILEIVRATKTKLPDYWRL